MGDRDRSLAGGASYSICLVQYNTQHHRTSNSRPNSKYIIINHTMDTLPKELAR